MAFIASASGLSFSNTPPPPFTCRSTKPGARKISGGSLCWIAFSGRAPGLPTAITRPPSIRTAASACQCCPSKMRSAIMACRPLSGGELCAKLVPVLRNSYLLNQRTIEKAYTKAMNPGEGSSREPKRLLIGVDGGGTGSRARITNLEGCVLGAGGAEPAAVRLGIDRSLAAVESAARAAAADAGLPPDVLSKMDAVVGLAGVGRKGVLEALVVRPHPFRSVRS